MSIEEIYTRPGKYKDFPRVYAGPYRFLIVGEHIEHKPIQHNHYFIQNTQTKEWLNITRTAFGVFKKAFLKDPRISNGFYKKVIRNIFENNDYTSTSSTEIAIRALVRY